MVAKLKPVKGKITKILENSSILRVDSKAIEAITWEIPRSCVRLRKLFLTIQGVISEKSIATIEVPNIPKAPQATPVSKIFLLKLNLLASGIPSRIEIPTQEVA